MIKKKFSKAAVPTNANYLSLGTALAGKGVRRCNFCNKFFSPSKALGWSGEYIECWAHYARCPHCKKHLHNNKY